MAEGAMSLAGIDRLEASLTNIDLRVSLGDEDSLRYTVHKGREPLVEQKDGTLRIAQTSTDDTNIISFNRPEVVEVTLSKRSLKNVNVDAQASTIVFEGIDANGSIRTTSGDISVANVEDGNDIELVSSSGDVRMSSCTYQSVTKESSSGDGDLRGVRAKMISAISSSGDNRLEAFGNCDVRMETSSGDNRLILRGNKADWNYDLSVTSGKILFDGKSYEDTFSSRKRADYFVTCKASSGNITVEFR